MTGPTMPDRPPGQPPGQPPEQPPEQMGGQAGERRPGPQVRSTLSVLVDLAAVMVLVTLALLGLASVFAGWSYLVVGVVAASLGSLLVLVTRHLPVVVLLAGVPIGAVLLGGPVALRDPGLGGGVPDLETLAEVMEGSVRGWGELLGTLPYVDVVGPPALVPFLLGFTGAALAAGLALRTRGAGAPLLPLLAVLVLVLLLRRRGEAGLEWFPLAFALAAIGWMVLRGLGLAPEHAVRAQGDRRGRLGRAVSAVLVVATALLVASPLTAGTSADSGETLRGEAAPLPELDGLDSPLRRFRTFAEMPSGSTDNVHRKLLFSVAGAPRGSRVRILTLDRYDGSEWLPGNGSMAGTSDDAFLRMDTTVDNPTRGPEVRAQVVLAKSWRSAWLPTLGSLTSLRFLFEETETRRADLRYDLATSTAVVPVGVGEGDDYELTAILPPDKLTPRMRPWPAPVLAVEGIRRADPLLEPVLASGAPPMRQVFVLARYLREEGRYSNGAKPGETRYAAGHDLERLVDEFLLAPRPVGNDEQYAAAMALLANRVGVPARVVVGAVLPRDGKVRGEDIHAWVELRISDGSWRTLPTQEFMGTRPPRGSMPPAPQPRVPAGVLVQPQAPVTEPEVQREERVRAEAEAAQRSLLLRVLPWLLLLLLALVVPLAKLARRVRRRRRGRPSDRVAGAWAELVDRATDLGLTVPRGVSRPAQARALARAGSLSSRADDEVFARAEPSEEEVAAYWLELRGEQRALSADQPLRRRLWAPFSPVTLFRSARSRD